jgi:alanine racemase
MTSNMTPMKPIPPRAEHSPSEDEAGGILSIDLAALAANYRALKKNAGNAHCAAVVKGDAYGIGLKPAAQALTLAGASTFFVALLSEARQLRAVCPAAQIYVLNGLAPGLAGEYRTLRAEPVLGSWPEIEEWDQFARTASGDSPAAIHIDTGMRRHGLTSEDATTLAGRLKTLRFKPSLVMSHLACADEPKHPMNAQQIADFRALRDLFPGIPASLANSAALLALKDSHFDLVRPGISLYGGRAVANGENPSQPVVRLDLRIIQVRHAEPGNTVGYGAEQMIRRPSRIAVLAGGYADGILRAAGASDRRVGAEVVIAGKRCPLIGRISMDLMAVDVTDIPEYELKRGDYATILGEGISVDDLAAHAGTLGYEVLTNLGHRYARLYRAG